MNTNDKYRQICEVGKRCIVIWIMNIDSKTRTGVFDGVFVFVFVCARVMRALKHTFAYLASHACAVWCWSGP